MDRAAALLIVQRYVPPAEADGLILETAVTRQVGGANVTLYDPYAAALAYLMNPNTVKQRKEGSVEETYIDPLKVADYLQAQSTALRASWPAADDLEAWTFPDLALDVRGWGQ